LSPILFFYYLNFIHQKVHQLLAQYLLPLPLQRLLLPVVLLFGVQVVKGDNFSRQNLFTTITGVLFLCAVITQCILLFLMYNCTYGVGVNMNICTFVSNVLEEGHATNDELNALSIKTQAVYILAIIIIILAVLLSGIHVIVRV